MAVARHHVLLSLGSLRGSWRQPGGRVGVAGGVQGAVAGAVPLGVIAEEWAESRIILKNVYFFQHELSLGDSVARDRGCRERAGNDSVPYEVAPTFVARPDRRHPRRRLPLAFAPSTFISHSVRLRVDSLTVPFAFEPSTFISPSIRPRHNPVPFAFAPSTFISPSVRLRHNPPPVRLAYEPTTALAYISRPSGHVRIPECFALAFSGRQAEIQAWRASNPGLESFRSVARPQSAMSVASVQGGMRCTGIRPESPTGDYRASKRVSVPLTPGR